MSHVHLEMVVLHICGFSHEPTETTESNSLRKLVHAIYRDFLEENLENFIQKKNDILIYLLKNRFTPIYPSFTIWYKGMYISRTCFKWRIALAV